MYTVYMCKNVIINLLKKTFNFDKTNDIPGTLTKVHTNYIDIHILVLYMIKTQLICINLCIEMYLHVQLQSKGHRSTCIFLKFYSRNRMQYNR